VRSIIERILPAAWIKYYAMTAAATLYTLGVICLAACLRALWQRRHEPILCSLTFGTICLLFTPIFITHGFASRYVSLASPLLILMVNGHDTAGRWKILRTLAGVIVSVVFIYGYLYNQKMLPYFWPPVYELYYPHLLEKVRPVL
jgi:hypothetical protein